MLNMLNNLSPTRSAVVPWAKAWLLLTLACAFTGCGKDEFVKQVYETNSSSLGAQAIPAKTDILFVVDNSASFTTAYTTFRNQLSSFVNGLVSQGWDYHMASIPTHSYDGAQIRLQQILTDPYLNTPRLASGTPNLGYTANGAVTDPSLLITNPSSFLFQFPVVTNSASLDYVFQNIDAALYDSANRNSHFIRNDSLVVIIVISNGNDSSGDTVSAWANRLTLRVDAQGRGQRIKFIPLVSGNYVPPASGACWGEGAQAGLRYLNMANIFNPNIAFDFCGASSQGIESLIAGLNAQLQAVKRNFVTRAIFIPYAPVASSIEITKLTPNGRGGYTEQSIPKNDARNGWTYEGYRANEYTIIDPFPANQSTGYMIELHGTAQLSGDQTFRISYSRQ